MNGRRIVQLALVLGVALAASLVCILVWRKNRLRLPALAHYPALPAQFDRVLQSAWASASSRGHSAADLRELARLYQANRLYAEARACYKVIAAGADGLSARDHYYLAAIAGDESDLGQAESELRAALQAEPGYLPARLALADALFKEGRPDDAGKEYAGILATEPDHPQAAFGLARVELQQGNEDGAVALLRDVTTHQPVPASSAALLAQILGRRGDAEAAASMRELAGQSHDPVPADPWLQAMQADCYDLQRLGIAFEQYRLNGQMEEALSLLGRLEELDPNGWIPPMLHGWSQKQAGHLPEAVEAYRTALGRGGDPERICPLLVAALLTEGHANEASVLLADYHSRLPRSIPILLSYCEVAVRLNDTKLARSLLTEALQTEPFLYMPNMSMAQILWTSGERDAASLCLLRVAKVFPNDLDSRGLLGQYYLEKTDPWSAITPLEQAVALVPAQSPKRDRLTKMLDTAYLTAGSLEASRGDFAKAVGFSDKSIQLVPGGLRGYALKANVSRHMGDLKGAEAALDKMSSLEPNEATIQLSLGDVTYQDGDKDGARRHWQRAMELAPAGASDLRAALGLRLSGKVSVDTFR